MRELQALSERLRRIGENRSRNEESEHEEMREIWKSEVDFSEERERKNKNNSNRKTNIPINNAKNKHIWPPKLRF